MVKCKITNEKHHNLLHNLFYLRKQFTFSMEKTALISELRTRVGEDNCKVISDKTFDGVAESVLSLFADDSAITDDTYKLPVATLIQFAGQKRFDEAAFAKKFKEDYAAQYAAEHEKDAKAAIDAAVAKALEDYKKAHPEQNPDDVDGKIAAALEEKFKILMGEGSEFGKLSKGFSEFLEKQTKREKTELRNRVKAELKKHLLDLKADNEACVDDALDGLDYGDEPTFQSMKETAVTAYEQRYKRYYGDGGKPFGGKSSGGSFSKEQMDDYIKRAEAKAKDAEDYANSIQFAK